MKVAALAVLVWASTAAAATDPRRSGYDDMTPSLQAMQRDDAVNPAMLGVADGAALWERAPAPGQPSCASCHGDASVSMRGVAARYPAFDTAAQRPVTLAQRLNACRVERQRVAPLPAESEALLGLEAFVALQSRGLPIAPPTDPRLQPYVARGEALFRQRMGQLDFSCSQCHDERAGGRLGGATIPQAHPTGYPIYRLEWQGLASLQRRLRSCMTGVRAEPFSAGAPEWIELELYLAQRAAGMKVETPAVRP
jgi:sulfur-oxidizing protein SoxA